MVHFIQFPDPPRGVPTVTLEQSGPVWYESDKLKAYCETEDGLPPANMSWMFTPLPHLTEDKTMVDNKQRITLNVNVNTTKDQH